METSKEIEYFRAQLEDEMLEWEAKEADFEDDPEIKAQLGVLYLQRGSLEEQLKPGSGLCYLRDARAQIKEAMQLLPPEQVEAAQALYNQMQIYAPALEDIEIPKKD